jgi:hypothetical protein
MKEMWEEIHEIEKQNASDDDNEYELITGVTSSQHTNFFIISTS